VSETYEAAVHIAPDDGLFRGHFTGEPILPGVAQIGIFLRALGPLGLGDMMLTAVAAMKLRQPIRPGDDLTLQAHGGEAGMLRCRLLRKDELVSNATLQLGARLPSSTHGQQPPAAGDGMSDEEERPQGDGISDEEVRPQGGGMAGRGGRSHGEGLPEGTAPVMPALPHGAPARLLNRTGRYSAEGLSAECRIPAASAFVAAGQAPAYVCIEAAAQCAAAWEAMGRHRAGGDSGPRVGYLVAMKDVALFSEQVPADRPLQVDIAFRHAAMPLSRYEFTVRAGAALIARGLIDTVLTDRSPRDSPSV